jgi:hypothetical protein
MILLIYADMFGKKLAFFCTYMFGVIGTNLIIIALHFENYVHIAKYFFSKLEKLTDIAILHT